MEQMCIKRVLKLRHNANSCSLCSPLSLSLSPFRFVCFEFVLCFVFIACLVSLLCVRLPACVAIVYFALIDALAPFAWAELERNVLLFLLSIDSHALATLNTLRARGRESYEIVDRVACGRNSIVM